MAKRLVFQRPIITHGCPFFPFTHFLCAPYSPTLVWCAFFADFLSIATTMVPKKTVPAKRHRSCSTSLCNRSFVPERGFPTSNAFFNFTIHTRGWQTLCAPPTPEVASVVQEFHSNLRFLVGTTVFVRGRWVDFGARTINQIYQLWKDDSKEYQALYMETDFESMMQELTQGQGVWRHHPSTDEFTTFQMHALTPLAKVWYNFLCVKIKPSLHLSTVTKDKTILLYTMTKGFQFDIRKVIAWGLIESTHGRCTGALIHPSLITQLCRSAEVPILDTEEQVQLCLPIPLPRVKFGSPYEFDDETNDDVPTATPSASDPVDDELKFPSSSTQSLADQIHALTTRFDAY